MIAGTGTGRSGFREEAHSSTDDSVLASGKFEVAVCVQ